MSMTKKDFQALANTLCAAKPADTLAHVQLNQWKLDVLAVSLACEQSPRFIRSRWLEYIGAKCGVQF